MSPIFTEPGDNPRGRKLSVVWTRTNEDVATIGMHFLKLDGGHVADFTDSESATLETRILALWEGLKHHFTGISLDRLIWHSYGVGIRKPNPAVREFLLTPARPGTNAGTDLALPPQAATSVTFKTARRRNWGRVYLPATVEASIADGRFQTDYITDVRDAFGTLIDGASDDNTPMVVWSPRHAGEALQFFKRSADHPESANTLGLDNPDSSSFARTVDQVQVDDIVDTIRSRRFAVPATRLTHVLGG